MKEYFKIMLFVGCLISAKLSAQQVSEINPELLTRPWTAKWIAFPENSTSEYGVYLFRKEIILQAKPDRFIIHVSADNRYKLSVNGVYICNGPARSHLFKWNFESVDISTYLNPGKNIISVVVWNFAEHRPLAQISGQTGLIIQGNSKNEHIINTDTSWAVIKDAAYNPMPVNINQYYAMGAGEDFNGEKHPWNWMDNGFNPMDWKHAHEVETGKPLGCYGEWGGTSIHLLSRRELPFMEEKNQRFSSIRRTDISTISDIFLKGKTPLIIPANANIKILVDQNELTTAYPVLNFSKGRQSTIKLTYAESLFDTNGNKGNRNEIENKGIIGNADLIRCDGGNNRIFQTLWWRTFRYIELEIKTKDEPLILNDFYSIFSAYPLQEKANFECDNPIFKDIWNVGWRTQRLCANETFFDCPYYEQLQYIGDSRIQAMVSSYVSGDSRLSKNAISILHESRMPLGITQSRFPCNQIQIIPTFSLVWVTMVYDYWMLNDDSLFIKSMIPGMQETLNWFRSRIDSTYMLGPVEWWDFVDWVNSNGWDNGNPPAAHKGNSSILSLQYAYTLEKAAIVFDAFRLREMSSDYKDLAASIKKAVYEKCFDSNKGLIADSPEKTTFSQHANIWGILTNSFPETMSRTVIMNQILSDKELAQATLYFKFYLFEAMDKVGEADKFLPALTPWIEMQNSGLSTFAETPDPARSDCHAWSASPVYYFLSLVSGIKPASPGFKSVHIEPNFGNLKTIVASMPHKFGMIRMNLRKTDDNSISGEITLPDTLKGVFIWKGYKKQLTGGVNKIDLN